MHSHKIDFLGINLDHFISTVYCFSFVCVRVFQVLGAETKPAEEVLRQENNGPSTMISVPISMNMLCYMVRN